MFRDSNPIRCCANNVRSCSIVDARWAHCSNMHFQLQEEITTQTSNQTKYKYYIFFLDWSLIFSLILDHQLAHIKIHIYHFHNNFHIELAITIHNSHFYNSTLLITKCPLHKYHAFTKISTRSAKTTKQFSKFK